MADKILKRSEVDAKYKWNLDHIFPTQADWEAAFAYAGTLIDRMAAMDGHVAEDPRKAIRTYFELDEQLSPIFSYAFLSMECDNGDQQAQEMKARVGDLSVRLGAACAFLEPELLSLPEETLAEIANDPEMADYDVYIRNLIRQKPHTLSKSEERILAMSGELMRSPSATFDMLTNLDMKFPKVKMADGSEQELTEGTFSSFRDCPDRAARKQAFENIMNTYGSFGNTIASTYNASVKKDCFRAAVRNYPSARAAAMEPLQIPEQVYDNLVDVVHEALPVLNDYLKLRKDVMGLDELHMYDLYIPMVKDFDMPMPYEQAYDLVLEGMAPMGEDYVAKLREARDNGWIDVYPTENKSSGAFSSGGLRNVHPYVLLNHNDNLDCAFTIAHELGHSMHSYYSNTNQPAPKSDYSLFVAEVASTCNECIVMRSLLKKYTDPKAKAYLLNHFLEQFRTTVFRQTMFAEFERTTHEMAAAGKPLTYKSLSQVYYDLNKTYYGGACSVDEFIKNEWARIPHFYRAFYVYVYATGLCAAVTLSERILNEGAPAVADYRKFLSAGCSVPPIEALKLAGIDMSKPEPIRTAMKVFRETLEQFKAVL